MNRRVVIIGAGIGGLTAAIRLAQSGIDVTVIEARKQAGGLASGVEVDGFRFDAGPYVLLDRPGLEWALRQLGIDLEHRLPLQRIAQVYCVHDGSGSPVAIHDSIDATARGFEARWPGAGERYRQFVQWTGATYQRLQPLQWTSHPGPLDLIRTGAWRDVPFVLRSLRSVLKSTGLPRPVTDALGIWTHVAGQTSASAPSPLSLVSSAIHNFGACYPKGGIASIAETLYQTALATNVKFQYETRVRHIQCRDRTAQAVETENETIAADAVLSNAGLQTYLSLLDDEGRSCVGRNELTRLRSLPLQSPGVCAYLAVKGHPQPPYLRFRLTREGDGCRLLVTPGVIDPDTARDDWYPARLIAPMSHERAEAGGERGQREFLERVVHQETWWREPFDDVRILETRIPNEWGSLFHLHRNSMNPVMTARFLLTGRIPHRSPWIRRLYLAGSATHPGQWVSFCAVSGILAADRLLSDIGVIH